MGVRILVCDDDPNFVERMGKSIREQAECLGAEIAITNCSDPGVLSSKALCEFDIMFLDIDMGRHSGLDLARRVRGLQLNTLLIFVTNYVEFSLDGYEVNAFRYLLKADLAAKLPACFEAALAQLAAQNRAFCFFVSGEKYTVRYDNILYLESRSRTIQLHTLRPQRIGEYFYAAMEQIEKDLAQAGFLRVHKSYLVNMQYIQKLNYDKVQLAGGVTLPVSQKRFSEIKLRYMNWKTKQ